MKSYISKCHFLKVDPITLVGYEPRFLCSHSDHIPPTLHEVIITCIDRSDLGCALHFVCGKLQVACLSHRAFSFPMVGLATREHFPFRIRRSQYCLYALKSLL
jgi:hypothetical protein